MPPTSTQHNPRTRVLYFDHLRIAATFAVVILHVVISPPFLFNSDRTLWWWTILYKTIFSWPVPIFFMLSGALLLKKEEKITNIYVKRLPKIIVPFLFWNLIYIFFEKLNNPQVTYLAGFKSVLVGPVIYHFWFIYVLVGLYIITPLLRVLISNLSRKNIEYFLLLSLVVNSIYPMVNKFFQINIGIQIPFVSGHIGYYVLGYYLTTFKLTQDNIKKIYLGSIVVIPFIIFATYFLTAPTGDKDYFFLEPLSLPVIILSAGVFVFFQNFKFLEKVSIFKINPSLDIGRVCFGIYFSHVAVLGILEGGKLGFKLNETTFTPIIGIPLNAIVVFLFCLIFFVFLESIKTNKYLNLLGKLIY